VWAAAVQEETSIQVSPLSCRIAKVQEVSKQILAVVFGQDIHETPVIFTEYRTKECVQPKGIMENNNIEKAQQQQPPPPSQQSSSSQQPVSQQSGPVSSSSIPPASSSAPSAPRPSGLYPKRPVMSPPPPASSYSLQVAGGGAGVSGWGSAYGGGSGGGGSSAGGQYRGYNQPGAPGMVSQPHHQQRFPAAAYGSYNPQQYSRMPAASPNSLSNHSSSGNEQLSKTNLYIRGLTPSTTDADLVNLCKQYGKIISTKAIIDPKTNKCKGYGFVDFDSPQVAEIAVKTLQSQGVQAQMAKQQEQDPTNLYIANLPIHLSESDLESMFSPFGQVISTRILRDQSSISRGVGFARMESREKCEQIIAHFQGKYLSGYKEPLTVKFADGGNKKKNQSKQWVDRTENMGSFMDHGSIGHHNANGGHSKPDRSFGRSNYYDDNGRSSFPPPAMTPPSVMPRYTMASAGGVTSHYPPSAAAAAAGWMHQGAAAAAGQYIVQPHMAHVIPTSMGLGNHSNMDPNVMPSLVQQISQLSLSTGAQSFGEFEH